MQPTSYMMRDCRLRSQIADHRMALKIASYIQYFYTHFLSSVKVWEHTNNGWTRSDQYYGCLEHLPLNQILWGFEHSHRLYLLARSNGQYMFLKAKKLTANHSNSRLRLYCSDTLAPLIETIMHDRVYKYYIQHTRLMEI
jgi:hypothetical protein